MAIMVVKFLSVYFPNVFLFVSFLWHLFSFQSMSSFAVPLLPALLLACQRFWGSNMVVLLSCGLSVGLLLNPGYIDDVYIVKFLQHRADEGNKAVSLAGITTRTTISGCLKWVILGICWNFFTPLFTLASFGSHF